MKQIVRVSFLVLVAMLVGLFAGTQNANGKKAEKVLLSMKKNNLQEVDYGYVLSKIGNGTRNGAKALILDARPFKKYKVGHLPSSLSLPDTKFQQYKSVVKNVAKNKEIITYCGGFHCGKSVKLALLLKKEGFTNLKVYRAGFPDWKKRNYYEIDTFVAFSDFKKDSALFIDARPAKKFKKSSIVGALNIPDTKFEYYKGRLPINKKEKVIVFCGGYKCEKSHKVAMAMRSLGYKKVYVLASGFPSWKKAMLPTTGSKNSMKKSALQKPVIKRVNKYGSLKFGVDEGSVDGEWFKEVLLLDKVPSNVALIDVRSKEEFDKGHFKGAVHVPSETKPKEFEKFLPKNKEVVIYCSTGARSMDVWSGFKDVLKYPQKKLDKILYFDANIECKGENKCTIEVNEPLGM